MSSCHKSTFEIELSQQNKFRLEDSQDSALMIATKFPLSRYELREQVLMCWTSYSNFAKYIT